MSLQPRDFFSLSKLDLMRMCLGICIIIDGYPLIFFFKETLRLAPGSTAFTAIVLIVGFALMVPFTVLRRLYRFNTRLYNLSLLFLGISIFYMFTYNGDPWGFVEKDMIYYVYVFAFMFLLISIPNDIIPMFVPIVILFTLVSNLALVYSLIIDPFWTVGQRAAITYGDELDRSGNPHVFARNALLCIIASVIWATRDRTHLLIRFACLLSVLFSFALLIMTQTRSSILALGLMSACFIAFSFQPKRLAMAARAIKHPSTLVLVALMFVALIVFMRRSNGAWEILYGYIVAFIERNLENVYALVGLKVNNQTVSLDASAANRANNFGYFQALYLGHFHKLFLGQGYKFMYVDIPILEAIINHGIIGFIPYALFNGFMLYHSFKAMRNAPNNMSLFCAYFTSTSLPCSSLAAGRTRFRSGTRSCSWGGSWGSSICCRPT